MVSDVWTKAVFAGMEVQLEKNRKHATILNELFGGRRFFLICGGVRSGKSFITSVMGALLSEPSSEVIEESEPDLGWVIGPDYKQTRAEISFMIELFDRVGWVNKRSTPENPTSPWSFTTVWNFRWETKSSLDLRKIASQPPRVVLVPEAAQQPYEVWLKARERAAEKRGTVIMNGTLEKGLPWYADLLKRWKAPNPEEGYSISIPTWDNKVIYPGGYDDPEMELLRATFPDDLFAERFGAEPRKATGLVIPEFDYGTHVRDLPVYDDIPVELWIDPGKNAYVVLFVQIIGKRVHVLDRIYKRKGIAQDVIKIAMENPLWHLVMLNKMSHGVIDIAGKHEYGLPSHVEVWNEEAGISLRTNYVFQEDSRNVVRYRLKEIDREDRQPLLLFNSNMTSDVSYDGQANDVLSEFNMWKWRDFSPNSSEPLQPIDSNNHAIKALGYGLYDIYGPVYERTPLPKMRQRAGWN